MLLSAQNVKASKQFVVKSANMAMVKIKENVTQWILKLEFVKNVSVAIAVM